MMKFPHRHFIAIKLIVSILYADEEAVTEQEIPLR